MKKFVIANLVVLLLMPCVSCKENKSRYYGLYHAVYVSPASDMPHSNIDLDIHLFQDTMRAQMAVHHYYQDNLLYSELTDVCVPTFNKDTLILDFLLRDKGLGMIVEDDEMLKRDLKLKFKLGQDGLILLSSSDNDVIPDDFIVFRKAVLAADSTTIILEQLHPRFTIVSGQYINGPVKRFKSKEEEYCFDEKGILVRHKECYFGKTYDARIEEAKNGATIATFNYGRGRVKKYYYNAINNQLYREEEYFNYSSIPNTYYDYEYDVFGRLTGYLCYYTKGGKANISMCKIERDQRGTIVGEIDDVDHENNKISKILKVDNYGNPLSVQYNYGYSQNYGDPRLYEYEYYDADGM